MKYWEYLIRRLGGMVASLVGLSILIFIISRVLPANPARMALGPMATDEQVAALAEEMGLNQPLFVQYYETLTGILTGNFGQSLVTKNPVAQDLLNYLPATLELITVAMVFTVFIGIPLGVIGAQHKDKLPDQFTRIYAFIGVSIPSFFVGLLLQVIFGYLLGWFPITGRITLEYSNQITSYTGFLLIDTLASGSVPAFLNAIHHLILPSFALSMAGTGQIMRITRSSMIDVQNSDYIESIKAFGLPNWLVTYKYTLRNSVIPTLTIVGLLYASLMGNAFLIEVVYAWPGLASYGINAIMRNDFNAVIGVVMIIGLAFVVINLVVDILRGQIDPKTRLEMKEGT